MEQREGIFFFKKKGTGQVIDLKTKEKYFVFFRNFNKACDNDTVTFVLKNNSNEKIAIIKNVLKRSNKTYFFTVKKKNNFLTVENLDICPYFFRLSKSERYQYLNKKVAFKIISFITFREVLIKVIKIFDNDVSLEFLIKEILNNAKINLLFSTNVLNEAKNISIETKEFFNRTNLSHLSFITIDGETAKDFDDAIYVVKEKNQWILYVSIADVSYFVPKNSALDKEAYERGNSIYFLDQVIPMLPLEISAGFASLQENQKKLTLTCKISVDFSGKIIESKIFKSFINSCARLTYDEVNDFFYQNKKSKKLLKNEKIPKMLKEAHNLFCVLEKKKKNNGYLEFNLQEKIFKIKNNQAIFSGFRKDLIAENLIEHFMICANEEVAKFLVNKKINGIFRVHKNPKKEALDYLFNFLKNTFKNFNLKYSKEVTNKDIQNCLYFLKNNTNHTFFYSFVLKAMEKATYNHINCGHFALGSKYYCHFTSPIRRYSDLIVHRTLHHYLENQKSELYSLKELEIISNHVTVRENLTDELNYKIEDLLSCSYLEKFINKQFTAFIVSILNFGIFIQLENEMDGLIFCEKLAEKNYFFQKEKNIYFNKKTNDTLFISKKIKVILKSSDIYQRKIDFDLVL
ncbi:VacB/RNase II family 3'-5' exoribonuclease [symbiont of Argiope bruennichi]|uniref:ribonuclease R family protein n=1 Tax=symbiont of Argiope bruennichi TaxID=2810479 RepID=UPI003DA6B23F